jgi:hypothetical protein
VRKGGNIARRVGDCLRLQTECVKKKEDVSIETWGCQDYFGSHLGICGLASPIVSRYYAPAPDRCHRVDGSPFVRCGCPGQETKEKFIARLNLTRVTVDILGRMVWVWSGVRVYRLRQVDTELIRACR